MNLIDLEDLGMMDSGMNKILLLVYFPKADYKVAKFEESVTIKGWFTELLALIPWRCGIFLLYILKNDYNIYQDELTLVSAN